VAESGIMPYPKVGFAFQVKFEGVGNQAVDTMFQEVGGLSRQLSIESLEEGGENRFVHRLPGRATYENLSLKRGVVTDSALIKWFEDAIENLDIKPAQVNVMLLDVKKDSFDPIITWNFINAWPVKWSVSNLNATSNAVAIDTIEFAYQYFRRT
jgi:phage tail-like protein